MDIKHPVAKRQLVLKEEKIRGNMSQMVKVEKELRDFTSTNLHVLIGGPSDYRVTR